MDTTDAPAAGRELLDEETDAPRICAYATSEERTVFTESGNGDGWIATDLTVEPES